MACPRQGFGSQVSGSAFLGCVVHGLGFRVYGVWLKVYDLCSMDYSLWFMVCGVWSVFYFRFMGLSSWFQVEGFDFSSRGLTATWEMCRARRPADCCRASLARIRQSRPWLAAKNSLNTINVFPLRSEAQGRGVVKGYLAHEKLHPP